MKLHKGMKKINYNQQQSILTARELSTLIDSLQLDATTHDVLNKAILKHVQATQNASFSKGFDEGIKVRYVQATAEVIALNNVIYSFTTEDRTNSLKVEEVEFLDGCEFLSHVYQKFEELSELEQQAAQDGFNDICMMSQPDDLKQFMSTLPRGTVFYRLGSFNSNSHRFLIEIEVIGTKDEFL